MATAFVLDNLFIGVVESNEPSEIGFHYFIASLHFARETNLNISWELQWSIVSPFSRIVLPREIYDE